ncbi:DedA family protein [Streptomyces sp. NRRL S-813]|uniref:DedA family protein n=1 Tax=Streptomyces sp. NRRL S-813 TaxID=1463919 RepID=UPI000AF7CA76
MTSPPHLAAQLAVNVLDAHSLLAAFGVLGVGVVMFAETGLLIGFFLPGDSLLFTAGLLCTGTGDQTVKLSLAPLLIAAAVGALAGAQFGYLLGRKAGGALIAHSRSRQLHEGVKRAEELLERYGHGKAVVLAGCRSRDAWPAPSAVRCPTTPGTRRGPGSRSACPPGDLVLLLPRRPDGGAAGIFARGRKCPNAPWTRTVRQFRPRAGRQAQAR